MAIWLDWANNGTSIKLFTTTAEALGTQSGSFTIPASMPSVNATKLRIVTNFNSTPNEPCGNYAYGETEDYLVNIVNPCPTNLVIESPPAVGGVDYNSGTVLRQANAANGNIAASNKILGMANVTYEAKSVNLNVGFRADNGTVFRAQVGGCN